MTPPDTDGLTARLLTLMGIGGVASGVADTMLSRGPAIVLGALASLIVGLALEWARPIVRAHGERAARRLARASTPPTPPTSEP